MSAPTTMPALLDGSLPLGLTPNHMGVPTAAERAAEQEAPPVPLAPGIYAANLCLGMAGHEHPSTDQLAKFAARREEAIRRLDQGEQEEDEGEEGATPTTTAAQGSRVSTTPTPGVGSKSETIARCWQPDPSTCRLAAVLSQAFYHIATSPSFPGIPLGGDLAHSQDGTLSALGGEGRGDDAATERQRKKENNNNRGVRRRNEFPFDTEREIFALTLAAMLHATKQFGIFCKVKYIVAAFWPLVGNEHPIALELARSGLDVTLGTVAGGAAGSKLQHTPTPTPTAASSSPSSPSSSFLQEIFAFEMMLSQMVVRTTLASGGALACSAAPLVVLPEHVVPDLFEGLVGLGALPTAPWQPSGEGRSRAKETEGPLVPEAAEVEPISAMVLHILKAAYSEPQLVLAGSHELAVGAVIVACCCHGVVWNDEAWDVVRPRLEGIHRKPGQRDFQLNYALLWEVLTGCRQIVATLFEDTKGNFEKNFTSQNFLHSLVEEQAQGSRTPVADGWRRRF